MHINLDELHYRETGSYAFDKDPLSGDPLDKWAVKKILAANSIVVDMLEYAEQNDPGNPHIERARRFVGEKTG